jgi:hypothetical protein
VHRGAESLRIALTGSALGWMASAPTFGDQTL